MVILDTPPQATPWTQHPALDPGMVFNEENPIPSVAWERERG